MHTDNLDDDLLPDGAELDATVELLKTRLDLDDGFEGMRHTCQGSTASLTRIEGATYLVGFYALAMEPQDFGRGWDNPDALSELANDTANYVADRVMKPAA